MLKLLTVTLTQINMKQTEKSPLDPHLFAGIIHRDPEFLRSMPQIPVGERNQVEFREQRQRALANGAIAIADRLERKNGEYDLNANLFRLVGQLGDFQRDTDIVDSLRKKYGKISQMPNDIKDRFRSHKTRLTEFNHTLHEVINAGASKFNFDQLLEFMTTMYMATGNRDDVGDFNSNARSAIVGMRNEMAVEQLLIAGGYDYTLGTVEQDAEGGDVIVEGIPIDLKASKFAEERAKQRAQENGYYHDNILWSHIEFQDYDGQLTLPYNKVDEILARLKPDLDHIIHTSTRQYA